tara:strand:- start:7661 stop:9118 length:1458 start_codon:yes stop_codon:yes gene_type:complete
MSYKNYIFIIFFNYLISGFFFNPENISLLEASAISYNDFRSSNPASMANHRGITIKLIGINFGIQNNFLSISNYNDINGANFDDISDPNYYPKSKFYELFNEGMQFNSHLALNLPFSDVVYNNISFHSKTYAISQLNLPQSLVQLALYGNQPNQNYNLNAKGSIDIISEYSIGYSKKISNTSLGVRLKYLQGLVYGELTNLSDNSSYFFTDTTIGFLGESKYLINQAVGGSGFAMDLGVIYKKINSNWTFGLSANNLFGTIYWDSDNLTYNLLKDDIIQNLPLRHNEKHFFSISLDTLNAMNMMGTPLNEIYSTESFSVIEFNSLDGIPFNTDSLIANNLLIETDYGSYLLKTDQLSNDTIDLLGFAVPDYKTDYPTYINMNIQKDFEEQVSLCFNISTGFSNSLQNLEKWTFSSGLLFNRFKKIPITLGISLSEKGRLNSGFSMGYNAGPFLINYGMSFKDAIFLQSAKGIDLSLSLLFKINNS